MPEEFDDWKAYKLLVIEGLQDMKGFRKDVNDRFDELTKEVAIIKTEVKHSARNWALFAGIAAALVVSAASHFFLR